MRPPYAMLLWDTHVCVMWQWTVSDTGPVASLNEEHVMHFLQWISCKIKHTFWQTKENKHTQHCRVQQGASFFTLTPALWLHYTTHWHIFLFLFVLCQLWPQAAHCFNLFPIGPKSKSASVELPAPTQRKWLEYDIIFQAELIVSGAWFSPYGCVRTLLCYTMQPWLPGMALMKTYEELDASWLSREG